MVRQAPQVRGEDVPPDNGRLDPKDAPSEVNENSVEETRHWLSRHPSALPLDLQAVDKYSRGVVHRSLLDDLRPSHEKLLHDMSSRSQDPEFRAAHKEQGGGGALPNSSTCL